jgi:uncharacterized membrane protein YeiH
MFQNADGALSLETVTANEVLVQMATAIFAVTGVLAAARQNMDVMSFVIVGVVTAVGGGTLRDMTLDTAVFWLKDPTVVYVATGAAIATFCFEQRFRATFRAFLYLDAVGTAVFSVIASERTQAMGFASGIAVVMGVLTGIGGGVLRDLLTGQPSLLTRRELYLTPILLGVMLYVVGVHVMPGARAWLAALAILLIAAVRVGAIRWGWAFPDWLTYKPFKQGSL